ncbi:MAG: sulfate adenylyltransferase subunit CysN [Pirellulaceae bacterium]|nr:sulfate adenylyltransferase subunit CysN [Pirellulaceae bacterium]
MSHQSDLISTDIEAYLAQHERKELMRFITCGSVDDGKSTLIGRLLYDSKMIYEDQLAAIEKASVTHGTTGGDFDPALLTDGLKAEREQGITIDVAYRYFSTAKRKFIIADTPGHEQYTRNMATGASTADLAVILVDARNGVVSQTKRHSFIVTLLGIKHVLVAINKMDLVDFDQKVYEKIQNEYRDFAARLDMPDLHFMPLSALNGDNVVNRSDHTPWYQGPPLMEFLESIYIGSDRNFEDFRFPVQYVNRPHLDYRGFCGTLSSGIIRQGEEVMVLPSRKTSKVKSIVTYEGEVDEAFVPQSVTLTLEDEIDISRGDLLVRPNNAAKMEQDFESMVVWLSEEPLLPGKQYLIKQTTRVVSGSVRTLRYKVDVNTLHRQQSPTLSLNEIGRCEFALAEPLYFDDYRRNRATGSFIVIDRMTNATVGAGMMIDRQTSQNRHDHWEGGASETLQTSTSAVTLAERKARFGQSPCSILLTGLTGSGKTAIAYALERKLFDAGRAAVVLDGQNLRQGISKDLGFSKEDRSENMRRAAEIAKTLNHSGFLCIMAMLAPSEDIRQKMANTLAAELGEERVEKPLLVVHLDCPVDICRQRRPDHYERVDNDEIVSIVKGYEKPENPALVIKTDESTVDEAVEQILTKLEL